ncbi:MAG: aldehyde ferredoxin oxidoreductase family protein [Candidatus Helarchaeota archaeon]
MATDGNQSKMGTNARGFTGKILWVNLSDNTITEEKPSEDIYRKYLGGYGLGVYYIYSRIKPNCDPLGPDNILGFCPGLFTGTPAPYTGRYMICGKSPLTGKGKKITGEQCSGGWGDANSGGYFGPAIKQAGYDAIFVQGVAEKPVYLLLDGKENKILDASDLWGKDAVEADLLLQEKHGRAARTALIGMGGEKQILFSGVVNDKGRLAARSGLGAVMGSKKLKAICIVGNEQVNLANREKTLELAKMYNKQIKKYMNNKLVGAVLPTLNNMSGVLRTFSIPFSAAGIIPAMGFSIFSQFFHKWGTPYFTDICADIGDSPIKNFMGTYKDFPKKLVKKINYKQFMKYKKRSFGCFGCPVKCGAILEVPELEIEETHRPEYETIMALGGLALCNDLKVLIEANEYLNRAGVDTISAGVVVAFAIECAERGILKKEDFKCKEYPDGFLPEWGKAEYTLPLLRMIVNREGIGDILAKGAKEASKKIEGSEEYAITANGQELPLHDARLFTNLGLTFTVDPTPGRHTAGSNQFAKFGPAEKFIKGMKIKTSKNPQKMGALNETGAKFQQWFNALGFCEFSMWCGRYPVLEMIEAVVGWEMTLDELTEIGWRIQTLRQMFNAREGAIRHEIARRAIGDPPLEKGPNKKVSIDVETMAQAYYESIGFDETGVPKEETLKELGLEFCIKDLKSATGRPEPFVNQYLASK